MATKKRYSEEFKRDAIRLQETSGKSVSEIERELGLSHNLLRQWKKRYQVNGTSNELERSAVEQLRTELRQAQRELEIVRQERDILKKTIRIFSQEAQP
jgi:transposase